MSQSFSTKALRGAMWAVTSAVFPNLIALLVFIITSRVLTPSDFGAVAIAASIALTLAAIVPAGYGEALVQREHTESIHYQSTFTLCLIIGFLLFVGMALSRSLIATLFHLPLLTVIVPVMAIRLIFDAIAIVPNAIVARSMEFHLLAARTVIATLLSSCIAIWLAVTGFGLWALVASQVVGSIASAAASLWAARWVPKLQLSREALKELTGYGLYASATKALQTFIAQSDSAIIGLFLGTSQVGLYNFARRIYSIINENLSGALNIVAHPMFSNIQSDKERVRRGFALATFISSAISFPLFMGLGAVSDTLVPLLFGARWNGAILLLKIFCIHGLISCIGLLQAGLIRSQGKARWWFFYSLANGLSSVLIIAVCARFGAVTMLAVNVIKSFMLWPFSVGVTVQVLKWNTASYLRNFIGPVIASVGMLICIAVAREYGLGYRPISVLLIDVVVGAASYTLILFIVSRERVVQVSLLLRGFAKPRARA